MEAAPRDTLTPDDLLVEWRARADRRNRSPELSPLFDRAISLSISCDPI